ncbi:MAG: hypothetical protein NW201_10405 [Gemmatimonadales bacterium]|nr:hypothetical protein [Gemmatimonadales bacterium]
MLVLHLRALTTGSLLLMSACGSSSNEPAASRPAVSPNAAGRIAAAWLSAFGTRPDASVELGLQLANDGTDFDRTDDLVVEVAVPGRPAASLNLRACRYSALFGAELPRTCGDITFELERGVHFAQVAPAMRAQGIMIGPVTRDSLSARAVPFGARSDEEVLAVLRTQSLVRGARVVREPGPVFAAEGMERNFTYHVYLDRRANAAEPTVLQHLRDGDTLTVTARDRDGTVRTFRLPYQPSAPRGVPVGPAWDW